MQVKSIKGHFINEFETELSSAIHNDFKPDLALVFCSVAQNINEIQKIFHKNSIDMIGATTAGEIFNHTVLEKSIVALLIKLDESAYHIDFYENEGSSVREIANQAATRISEKFTDPTLIVFSGGIRADGEELVNGLLQATNNIKKIYGALAGDDLQIKNTYVFTDTKLSNNGIACLAFDSARVKAEGVALSGWKSIGTEKLVTSSKGNVVFTIDHQPALDIFLDYFNKPKERLKETDLFINELAQYPLQVQREEDYFVLRAPMMADVEKGALVFSGTVKQGARIKFSVPPGFETIETISNEIAKLKNTLKDADAILLFSCKARHQALGPLVEEEIEGIQSLWNVPLIGFFSYGEIGNIENHSSDFHNETISLVVFKE